MSGRTRTSSSSSSDSESLSEGEYMLQDYGETAAASGAAATGGQSASTSCTSDTPQFNISHWNPEAPAGLQFLSLLPFSQGYEVPYPQQKHSNKIKVSTTNRRARCHEFQIGKVIGKHRKDERKLRKAIETEDVDSVSELLESGADANSTDEKRRTPLHFAATKGNEKLVSLLISYGADPNAKDAIGNTPLHLAACTSQIHVVTLLLKAGTDIEALDNMGYTPLHVAHSRLKMLQATTCTSPDLKNEVAQVVEMMKEYLSRSGQTHSVDHLEDLCSKLQQTSTSEQTDVINDLLESLTNLQLQKASTGAATR